MSGNEIVELKKEIERQKKIIEQYKRESEQLSIILDNIPIVPYRCKAVGDFGATYICKYVTKLTGYSPQDFTSDSQFWISHIHKDDRKYREW